MAKTVCFKRLILRAVPIGAVARQARYFWQRVRGSNPCFGLERALIYLRKMLITSYLRITMFPVALLLLNSKSLSKRFVGSSRTVRAKIVPGSKGDTPGCRQPALILSKIAEVERRLAEIVSSWTYLIAYSITVTMPFSI
jgi:hypothetical protein